MERQSDAGFEIAAVVTAPDIAAKIDHVVAELHFDTAGKLTRRGESRLADWCCRTAAIRLVPRPPRPERQRPTSPTVPVGVRTRFAHWWSWRRSKTALPITIPIRFIAFPVTLQIARRQNCLTHDIHARRCAHLCTREMRISVCRSKRWKFTVTKVTPSGHRSQYDNSHDLSSVNVMTRLWRNSLEAAAAVSGIVLATLIVHLVTSWWPASAALH